MMHNDIMRSVRYALHLKNSEVTNLFKLAGYKTSVIDVANLLKKEEQEGFVEASALQLHSFLDGLITSKRGAKDGPKPKIDLSQINNNMVLRKLRIAFNLKDTDVLDILKLSNFKVSKSELGAFSRKPSHANYANCGDQIIRYFLKGLSLKFREEPV
jgi:uncharacterized protein YehS (DUF1456 family)